VEDEVQHHLAADGLVAVHVGHVLHVRLAHHVLVRRPEIGAEIGSGADVMIFKISSPKNLAKNWRFLLKLLLFFWKKMILTLVYEKNANFFAENWQKSQKLVIITSTPVRFLANRVKSTCI
jgi:hypothetical protein